jgi:hypothetical protein
LAAGTLFFVLPTRRLWIADPAPSARSAAPSDTLDLRKHAFAVALKRERVHAPQHFPVGFRNGAWHGVDSVIFDAERE